jgi:hypothetical protein
MERFLGHPVDVRARAFEQAAAQTGWRLGSVEKDFWVCFVLRELFALPQHGEHLTFKGGTSLSKAWGLIDRFSEDIDLTIDRDQIGFGGARAPEAATSKKEQGRRLDLLRGACRSAITESLEPSLRARQTLLPSEPGV